MKFHTPDPAWVPDPIAIETAGVLVLVALLVVFAIIWCPEIKPRGPGKWKKP